MNDIDLVVVPYTLTCSLKFRYLDLPLVSRVGCTDTTAVSYELVAGDGTAQSRPAGTPPPDHHVALRPQLRLLWGPDKLGARAAGGW
jgi:hypothetical protein